MKIIAEIGLNHSGSISRAQNLLTGLCDTPVDKISFQIRESSFYDKSHPRKIHLPLSFYKEAAELIHNSSKDMCIAIADSGLVNELNQIGVDSWKTLSWDLNNENLQSSLSKTEKKIYLSTGVSDIEDIVKISNRMKNIEFIHTQLNDSIENTNLKAIKTIKDKTSVDTAFGLHCNNHDVLYTALAFEPSALFFYVKDNSNGEHPDDLHAIPLNLVKNTVENIRTLVKSIGDGKKEKLRNTLHPDDDDICK